MCLKCDGYSDDDVARFIELSILTHGWFVQGIVPGGEDPPESPTWAYTIGLTEGFDLPELIVVDTEFAEASSFLNLCGELLTSGVPFDELIDLGMLVRPVAETHLNGELFYQWANYYGQSGAAARFVQLVQPPESFCRRCYPSIPDLSDPDECYPRPLPWADAA